MLTRLLLGILAALVLMCASAAANDGQISDSDDSPGSLDVESASFGHITDSNPTTNLLVHSFRTFESWDEDILSDERLYPSTITFYFHLRRSTYPNRLIEVFVAGDGTLGARMLGKREGQPWRVRGFASVWRPDDNSLEVRFPPSLLAKDLQAYSWQIGTAYHESGHDECDKNEDVVWWCVDVAPEEPSKHKL